MTHSENLNELATALTKAQLAFAVPKKSHTAKVPTKAGGQYSYQYSTLDELRASTLPALAEQGLSVLQDLSSPDGGTVAVTTTILHQSGQWWTSGPFVLPSGNTPQTAGAAATYARRYSLGAALNVAAEEDQDAIPAQQATEAAHRARPAPTPALIDDDDPTGLGPVAGVSPTASTTVKDVTPRKGETNGKPWILYLVSFSDGTSGATFDAHLALAAERARDAGTAVVPVLEESAKKPGNYKLIEMVSDVTAF